MKKIVAALVCLSFFLSSREQTISQFTWDNASLSPATAAVGPNALAISSSAVISSNGSGSTNGLNAGTPAKDINMTLAGSYYTVNALDISIDFKRKESQASFFTLGHFDFGMNGGSLYFSLPLDSSNTAGYKTISLTNLYSLPSDNLFHTYRFLYNNITGVVNIYVDGTVLYTYTGTTHTNMNWTGAANATVGSLMDGTGSNIAILDNLIIKNSAPILLPLELLSFEARASGSFAKLNWSTTNESAVKEFILERSTDGLNYRSIGVITARDVYAVINNYTLADSFPVAGKDFYRLKMTDIDGQVDFSTIVTLNFSTTGGVSISCFPNPTVEYINIRQEKGQTTVYDYSILTLDGKRMQAGSFNLDGSGGRAQLNLSSAPKGALLLQLQNTTDHTITTIKILKG